MLNGLLYSIRRLITPIEKSKADKKLQSFDISVDLLKQIASQL